MSVAGDIAQGLTTGISGVWGKVLDTALDLIGRAIPDPAQRAAAQLQVLQLQQTGQLQQLASDTQLALAQADINKIEAASPSIWKSCWRPGFGWACVAIFTEHYLVWPFWSWVAALNNWPQPPNLDVAEILALSAPLLGLSGYRTVEKLKGVA